MTVTSLPTHTGIESIRITQTQKVKGTRSPFSLVQQTIAHTGQQWFAEVNLPVMDHADARVWLAWLSALKGPSGTFTMGDPLGAAARGGADDYSINGLYLDLVANFNVDFYAYGADGGVGYHVDGDSQTGSTLNIQGIAPNATGVLLAGDYVQLGTGSSSRLFMVTSDVDGDSDGKATLNLWPDIRTAPADNDYCYVANCTGLWRLANQEIMWQEIGANQYRISFSAESVVS